MMGSMQLCSFPRGCYATSFLIFASDTPEGARAVLFWLLGSLSLARWSSVGIAIVIVVAALTALVLWARRFDALAVGDDTLAG
jgi:iron complex transport system permease protein